MVISHDKDYKVYATLYGLVIIGILLLYVYGFEMPLWGAMLINSPAILLAILWLISYGRTFIMSKDGCTVCFLNYRKHYSWDDLKTKRIEHYSIPDPFDGTTSYPYMEIAIMAPYMIHKPKFMRPALYSCLRPLSCIYVNFVPGDCNYKTGRYYEINKEVFMQQMNVWGIHFENT